MRIGRVGVDRHDHRLLLHPFLFVATEHELRDIPLRRWFVGANAARNLGKSILNDAMHFVGSFYVHLMLSSRKHGLELLHQFRAAYRVNTERATEIDRSRIPTRDVR